MKRENQVVLSGIVAAVCGVGAVSLELARGQYQPEKKASQPADPAMQEAMKKREPGAEHRVLDGTLGSWEAKVKIWMEPGGEAMDATGSVTREWVLDGRFVSEKVDADCPEMGTFQIQCYTGYNTIEKKYEMVGLESKATWMTTKTGTYDAAKKTFTFQGDTLDPKTGKRVKCREVLDVSSPTREVMTGYGIGPDGKEFKNFEGIFEKK